MHTFPARETLCEVRPHSSASSKGHSCVQAVMGAPMVVIKGTLAKTDCVRRPQMSQRGW